MRSTALLRCFLALALVGLLCPPGRVAPRPVALPLIVASPHGTAAILFGLKSFPAPSSGERPFYRVTYRGQTVIDDSPLGVDLADAPPLDRDFQVTVISRRSVRTVWTTVTGKSRQVPDQFNEAVISLAEKSAPGRRMEIAVRAYEDGVAFRYQWPQQPHLGRFQITAERSEFRFPANHTVWALAPGFHTYESEYRKKTLADLPADNLQALPLLMSAAGYPRSGWRLWMALVEADLTEYAGMYVSRSADSSNTLVTRLPENRSNRAIKVDAQTPCRSPWRVLMLGSSPGALIESNLLLNLNPPCAIQDPSWIKPGKAAWNWWSDNAVTDPAFLAAGHRPGMNTATMEHYIDFAARMGLEYSLIDAGWSRRGDITQPNEPAVNMPEILAHAREKGVKVILWIHSREADRQMDEAFPLYQRWGVAGVKIDFMDSDDQTMVAFYDRALRKAAECHLVVDFHGAHKPTGRRRTWPNELTREGVLGLEYAKWSSRPDPEHNVTLPFTRMLVGPMDYTPGAFTTADKNSFRPRNTQPMAPGTRSHQLAMYVVFESELQMVSDFPENILGQVGADFIARVPTSWDETRVLNGAVGEYVTMARQRGREWYLGSMTNWTPRTLQLPLRFLGKGRYTAEIYEDNPAGPHGPVGIAFRKTAVTANDTLIARLASGGGCAVRFYPIPSTPARARIPTPTPTRPSTIRVRARPRGTLLQPAARMIM